MILTEDEMKVKKWYGAYSCLYVRDNSILYDVRLEQRVSDVAAKEEAVR